MFLQSLCDLFANRRHGLGSLFTDGQWKDLHLSEFHRMAFGLESDVPFVEHLLSIDDQLLSVTVLLIKLGLLIFQHDLPVDDMLDDGIAMHLHFHSHPLVTVISFRAGGYTMTGNKLAVHHDVGAGGAYVSG